MQYTLNQAITSGQQYLNTNYPGMTIGQTTTFYGYYTMQVVNAAGKTYGMMTVNGQTG
jgi:hypothetical protein